MNISSRKEFPEKPVHGHLTMPVAGKLSGFHRCTVVLSLDIKERAKKRSARPRKSSIIDIVIWSDLGSEFQPELFRIPLENETSVNFKIRSPIAKRVNVIFQMRKKKKKKKSKLSFRWF